MIAVYVSLAKPQNEEDFYTIEKVCYFNPDNVCAIKPAAYTNGVSDIMTTDGMRYRVNDNEHGLMLLKNWPKDQVSAQEVYEFMKEKYGSPNVRLTNPSPTASDS